MSDVYVKLIRPECYDDVCNELVIEDARIHDNFEPEDATGIFAKLTAELAQANARERDAYFAGYENGYVELAADYDVEESWQQYKSGDSK